MAGVKGDFKFATKRLDTGLVSVEVQGYMDADAGHDYLAELGALILRVQKSDKRSVGLIFKDELTGFEAGTAAKLHGQFFREMGEVINGVAIVSKKLSMRFGVAGAKLFAKQPIEVFSDEGDARQWLEIRASSKSPTQSIR